MDAIVEITLIEGKKVCYESKKRILVDSVNTLGMSHTYIFRSWKPIWSGRYGLSRVEAVFEMC